MPSLALSTFLPILIVAFAVIVWWRAMIVILGAFLIAVLVIGVHEVVDRFDQQPTREAVIGPPVDGDQSGPLNRTAAR